MLAPLTIPRTDGLFDERVRVRTVAIENRELQLFPVERTAMVRAVESRRWEFASGRVLARELLNEVGFCDVAIPTRADRTPQWPAGAVGSIAHADGVCVAAVGRSEDFDSIGIDLESDEPLEDELRSIVCVNATCGDRAAIDDSAWAKAVFCVKEAVYKCWFPVTRIPLEFSDVTAEVELGRGSFEAVACGGGVTREFRGRVIRRDGWILAGTAWEART